MENDKKNDCVFCKIVEGKIPATKFYDGDNFIVVKDAYSKIDGHCLILSKKHYETVLDLPATLGTELIGIAKKQGLRLLNEKKGEGFKLIQNNFKAAEQAVMHYHLHVIPYKTGK